MPLAKNLTEKYDNSTFYYFEPLTFSKKELTLDGEYFSIKLLELWILSDCNSSLA